MVKKGVPSLRDSERMRPRRRVITPYTRPRTSAARVSEWGVRGFKELLCGAITQMRLTGSLNLTAVHCQEKARTPI